MSGNSQLHWLYFNRRLWQNPQVAAAQDLLVYVTKGYCEVTTRLRKEGTNISDAENRMVVMNLFMTITNANFDKEAIENRIHDTLHVKKELLKKVKDTSGLSEAALWDGSGDWEVIAGKVGVLSNPDEDIRSLQQLITYGIKGLCAYTKHANALMHTDPKLDAFIQETLAKTLDNSLSAEELVALTLKTGEYVIKGMAMLDAANTGAYGDPEITAVNIGVRKNPGILVSGHDLRDLEMLLEQTKEQAWMCIPIQKCFLPAVIRPLRNIPILWGIMAMPGGSRKKNLSHLTGRSL